jgi:hypothetical protein
MLIKAGPVLDILLEHQGVNDPWRINWSKVNATQSIKNLDYCLVMFLTVGLSNSVHSLAGETIFERTKN